MCFKVYNTNRDFLIAEKDIICYKSEGKSYFFDLFLKSGYRDFLYLKNKITSKVKINLLRSINNYEEPHNLDWYSIGEINEGYHTYTEAGLGGFINSFHYDKYMYKFIIPKGTKYYYNVEQMVAEQIIYKGKFKVDEEFIEKCKREHLFRVN